MDKEIAWQKIDKRMRTAVRKAQSFNPQIKEVEGTKENIKKFYPFCPSREDLPEKLNKRQKMYFAYFDNQLAGGIVVTKMEDHLFLHFLGVTDIGREKQISSLLIWHIVEQFSKSEFRYLNIGASYKANLQKYFEGWETKKYPVIMRPPEYKPQLMITPFDNSSMAMKPNPNFNVEEYFNKRFKKEYTFFPRGTYAIFSLFKWFKITGKMKEGDEVLISTTTESPYISSCVTSAIEQSFSWKREISKKTKAIFVIHEFGFPHPQIEELKEISKKRNIPLIEDCAYAFQSGKAGEYGDYLIYSFSKIFPMQFGGLLVGKHFDFQYNWDNFGSADPKKEEICRQQLSFYLPQMEKISQKRRENFLFFQKIFGEEKTFFSHDPTNGEQLNKDIIPGAFVLKVESEKRMQEISKFVKQFGIECGNYWKNKAVFLPVHQNLNESHLEYITGAIKAMYREGCGL